MELGRPSYIIFDLGNVLVHIHPEAFLRSLGIDSQENRLYYQKRVADIGRIYERGDDSTDQFFVRLDHLFNEGRNNGEHEHGGKRSFTKDDFYAAMLAIIGEPVTEMEDLVRRVAAKVPLGLLSNTNPVHFGHCLDTLKVLRYIPSHFLSYRLKAFKPDVEIFKKVARILQLPPHEILYIDDLQENVAAAKSLGFRVILFESPRKLELQFAEWDLI